MMTTHGGPGRAYDPWAHADAIGVEVTEGRLRPNRWGAYRDADRLIVLAKGMTHRAQRSILAHEVQHAIHRDRLTMFGPLDARQERRARLDAAVLLISPVEYAIAETMYGPLDAYLADELDVIPAIIGDWRIAVRAALVRA